MNPFRDYPIDCISNDELMLKELERRDGIYSFIFHELEAPKGGNNINQFTTDSPIIDDDQMKNLFSCPELNDLAIEIDKKYNSHDGELRKEASFEKNDDDDNIDNNHNNVIDNIKNKLDSSKPQCHRGTGSTISKMYSYAEQFWPTACGQTFPSCSNITKHQEYLKPWNPPPSLVYDHPQLYAYMANCGFRVRVPPPRFSHVSVPLVRNRRHALKDSSEYKRCGVCLLNIPDLRSLFPHDPDVHAPFTAEDQAKKNLLKYMN